MGSLAYIKQVFSDTAHYTEAKAIYDAVPAGLERPTYDRTLEFLESARTNDVPFLMPANLGREIDRALALAERASRFEAGDASFEFLAECLEARGESEGAVEARTKADVYRRAAEERPRANAS